MTKRQTNSRKIGYTYSMKRLLLNAYRLGSLRIKTRVEPINNLDTVERVEIEKYAEHGQLWNKQHNPYYKSFNRWN